MMLLQRFLTALVLAPLVILIILLSSTPIFALIAGIAILGALWEWTALCGVYNTALRGIWLLVAALLLGLAWSTRSTVLPPIALGIGIVWWIFACLWLRYYAFGASPTRENQLLKMLIGFLVTIPAWIAMISIHSRPAHGHWWMLLALVIVWAADIGAYFSGRTFGKRKLAPHISPGKTWAGAYGALAAGILVALIGGWLLDIRGLPLALLALLTAITVTASIIGDLTESLMKRHAQVKDSGTLFPGHGGVLDRMDSVFAALPIFAAGGLLLGF